MNILLIGNGFDLAHGLPTKYGEFLAFCRRARIIYTYNENKSISDYAHQYLDNWKMDINIKGILYTAFDDRKYKRILQEDKSFEMEVTTQNEALDEMYTLINSNFAHKF